MFLATDDFAAMSQMMSSGPVRTLLTWILIAGVAIAIFAPTLFKYAVDLLVGQLTGKLGLPQVSASATSTAGKVLDEVENLTTRLLSRGSTTTAVAADDLGKQISARVAAIRTACPKATEDQIHQWLTRGLDVTAAYAEYTRWLEQQLDALRAAKTHTSSSGGPVT